MKLVDDTLTSPTLLRMVADWQDHPAWVIFRDRYDPLEGTRVSDRWGAGS